MVGRAAESICGCSSQQDDLLIWKTEEYLHSGCHFCLKKKAKSHFPQISTDAYKVFQIPLPRIKRCSLTCGISKSFLFRPFHSQVWELWHDAHFPTIKQGRVWAHYPTLYMLGQTNFPLKLLPDLSKAFRTKSQPDTKPFRSVPYAVHPRYLLPFAVPLVHPLTV